jgi:hypothetical protein
MARRPTSVGHRFRDGIKRHPVQLYESAAMFGFLVLYLREVASARHYSWDRVYLL